MQPQPADGPRESTEISEARAPQNLTPDGPLTVRDIRRLIEESLERRDHLDTAKPVFEKLRLAFLDES